MLSPHLDGDASELPRRLRRCSVAGGVADFETTHYDDSESDAEEEEEGAGGVRRAGPLSCSEGESGTDGEGDDGEAYVPSRGPGLVGPAGLLSRPLDIPRAVPVAAMAARRKSIASVKQASLHAHAHGQYMQTTTHRNSLTASHALSPAAHTYGGANSFVSAGSASADSSSTAWAASPAAVDNLDGHASSAAPGGGDDFYRGFVLAPSSLPLQGLTMLPAVPLPLPSSSRRSISPFTGGVEPSGRSHTDPAAVPAAFPSHSHQQHRLSVTSAMPAGSPLSSSSYGLPYGPGASQSRAASCGSTSGGSSNASPQGVAPVRSSGSSTASSSGSFTFSAAARFLPPSGAASSSYSSASYGAGGYGIGSGGGINGGGSSGGGQGSTFASPSSVSSTSSCSFSAAVSPLPPRAPLPSRFSSPPTGVPSPAPAHPVGGAAQLEEITSYEEIAHCPPHVQAVQSRRSSVAASTAALDLSPSMQSHHASHTHARPLALRCAGRAERDALQFEEEEYDNDLQGILGNSANIMPASGSPQSGGFELEFDM